MDRLDGKVTVIAGVTSGIGLRTAEVFVADGAKIVIAGRRLPEGEVLAAKAWRHTGLTITRSPSRGFGIGHICQSGL
jgi:NAD(P)-dependent dehydrogenase (short-subunit alcohol dehydrogenase family)